MNCSNCGSPIPDGNLFCLNCGAGVSAGSLGPAPGGSDYPRMSPSGPAPAPSPAYSSRPGSFGKISEGVRIVRSLAGSAQFLVASITFTLSIVLGLIVSSTAYSSTLNRLLSLLNEMGLSGSELSELESLREYAYRIDSASFGIGLLFSIPAILTTVGLWMTYMEGRKTEKRDFSTTGLSIIHVLAILDFVVTCIICAIITLFVLISVFGILSYMSSDDSGGVIAGILIGVALFALIIVLVLLYKFKVFQMVGAAKEMALSGKPVQKASMYVGIILMISAVFSLPGIFTGLATSIFVSLQSLCSIIYTVCFALLIFSCRSKTEDALLNPGTDYYSGPSDPERLYNDSPRSGASPDLTPYAEAAGRPASPVSPYGVAPGASGGRPVPPAPPYAGRPGAPVGRPASPASPYGGAPGAPAGRPVSPASPYGGAPGAPAGRPASPASPYGGAPGAPAGRPASTASPYGGSPGAPAGPSPSYRPVDVSGFGPASSSSGSGADFSPLDFGLSDMTSLNSDEKQPSYGRPAEDNSFGFPGFSSDSSSDYSMNFTASGPSDRLKGSLLNSLQDGGKDSAQEDREPAPSRLKGSLLQSQADRASDSDYSDSSSASADLFSDKGQAADVPGYPDNSFPLPEEAAPAAEEPAYDTPVAAPAGQPAEDYSLPEKLETVDSSYNPATVYASPYETTSLDEATLRQPHAYLFRVKDNTEFAINIPFLRIGRSSSLSDYVIEDNPAIGRHHADIVCHGTDFSIIDNNSVNHVYVDGSIIPAGQEIPLPDQAEIRLADETFLFKVER